MKNYTKKLLTLGIGTTILIGIPYYAGWIWLTISWLPALSSMAYLHEE